jgi:adenylylsulfate kinase
MENPVPFPAGTHATGQDTPGHSSPATVWLTGLSGAGKSTLARALQALLAQSAQPCLLLDGDTVRNGLNSDLGFSAADRIENVRRVAEVARLGNDAGLLVVAALISPLEDGRRTARQIIGTERFIEVHVSTSLSVCEARDTKGLYARARAGLIAEFTGVSSPYEAPARPDLLIDTAREDVAGSAGRLYRHLQQHGFVR